MGRLVPAVKRAAGVLVVCAAACAVYGSSLLVPGPDAGMDAGPDAKPPSCDLVRWPPRPNADDPSQGEVEVLVAVSSLHFVPPDGGRSGFDLDSVCTCHGQPPAPESCVPNAGATQHCDGDGGIDNSGGTLLSKFQQIGNVFSDSDLAKGILKGTGNILLRLQGWNGKPNDKQLVFSIYISNGTERDDAGNRTLPSFDGGDRWTVDTESLVGGTAPPYVPAYEDRAAYVSGGVLVASLDFPLTLGTRSVSRVYIRLKGAIVSARIVEDGSTFRFTDGVIAGRWPTTNFLGALAAFTDPLNPQTHLCGDSGTYQIIKTQVCKEADITSDLLSDGKGAPCDAISIALFFEATSAQFGPPEMPMPAPAPCGPVYMDDCR